MQSNPTLGDIQGNGQGNVQGNVQSLLRAREQALRVEPKLDLAVCSELAICGYQPDDLLLDDSFLDACEAGLQTLQRAIDADGRASLLLGAPRRETKRASSSSIKNLFNSAVLLTPNAPPSWCDKSLLPNYGVFDEQRYFSASDTESTPLLFKDLRLGIMICEDMWQPEVAESLARSEVDLFLVLNASPFEHGKALRRSKVANALVARHGVPLLYVNQVGGQDELLFDGGSFALNPEEEESCKESCEKIYRMPFFEEAIELFRFHDGGLTPLDKDKKSPSLPPRYHHGRSSAGRE